MKQKIETQTELSSKKKIVLTGDSIVNGISKTGLSVNYKVKVVNFPGGTSEKILEKLDVIIKEKSDDLIVHDITNNVNVLTNVKKIFNKVSNELPLTSIAFSSIINRTFRRTNIQKTLTDTNALLKHFCK